MQRPVGSVLALVGMMRLTEAPAGYWIDSVYREVRYGASRINLR